MDQRLRCGKLATSRGILRKFIFNAGSHTCSLGTATGAKAKPTSALNANEEAVCSVLLLQTPPVSQSSANLATQLMVRSWAKPHFNIIFASTFMYTKKSCLQKTDVFWDVLCKLVEVYRRFWGSCCLHHQCRSIRAGSHETSVQVYHTTRSRTPNYSNDRSRQCDNLESHPSLQDIPPLSSRHVTKPFLYSCNRQMLLRLWLDSRRIRFRIPAGRKVWFAIPNRPNELRGPPSLLLNRYPDFLLRG
jgi:hypothetical protein